MYSVEGNFDCTKQFFDIFGIGRGGPEDSKIKWIGILSRNCWKTKFLAL